MEEVSLTEAESRYYADLFLCCDEEKTGKIPMLKASELFRSAYLSSDKIHEVIYFHLALLDGDLILSCIFCKLYRLHLWLAFQILPYMFLVLSFILASN